MGDPTQQTQSGLSSVNLYGTNTEDIKQLRDAQQEALEALQNRYAAPNWWKVAAGFAKPQLGGFTASLGSASDALGEWKEQQRANQLPVAQMRSQLAQTDMLLKHKQIGADMLANWQKDAKPGEVPPPKLITEISAHDPILGKTLSDQVAQQQHQQEITSGIQKNALTALSEARNQGLSVDPEIYHQAGLKAPGEVVPTTDNGNITTLPGGARVNDYQKYLSDLGVPIISGVRTKEEQQKLYDNREHNPNPVAVPGTSKHETGKAFDVDPSKMTDEHRGMLKAMGFVQPFANDPNHWEIIPQKGGVSSTSGTPKAKDDTVVLNFMPDTSPTNPSGQQAELNKQQLLEQNKGYASQFSNLTNVIGPSSLLGNRAMSAANSLVSQLSYDPKDVFTDKDGKTHNLKEEQLNRVIGQLSQGGLMNAAMASAAKGMGISTPLGAAEVNLPFDTLLRKLVPKEDQAVAEKIATNIATIKLWQQQHTGQSLGNMPVGEFTLMDAASPSLSTTLSALRYNASKAHNNVEHLSRMQQEMEDIVNGHHAKYKLSPADRAIAYYSAFNSPAAREIRNSYLENEKEIDRMSEEQARAERRARQKHQ